MPVPSLLLLLAASALAPRARGFEACSRWPSDSAGAPPGWEWKACNRCLATRLNSTFRANHSTQVEIILNRNETNLDEDELPQVVCKLWIELCSISSISPLAFAHSPCLRRIFLNNNFILGFHPDTFSNNSELLHLELQKNKIVLPRDRVFIVSSTLRILDLSFNDINAVYNKTFKATPNLSILLLRSNKIRVLNYEAFSFLSRLEFLDVSENSLSTIDFAPKLTLICLYLSGNPLNNVFSSLMKFRLNVTLGFSQSVCCCNVKYCVHSASQWISKCEQCNRKFTSPIPPNFDVTVEPVINTIINYDDSTNASLSSDYINSKQKALGIALFPVPSLSPSAPESKKQAQTANITVVLLSTVFSFLILVQSSIIVFLLMKSKRKDTPSKMYLEVENKGIVIPSLIYGKNEQVTDLDEETYSQLSLNPVYETIPE